MPTSTPLSCAIVYAGENDESVLLALQHREGRFPAQFVSADPLYWVCADGALEHPELSGPRAEHDRRRLASEIMEGGLIAIEVSDLTSIDMSDGNQWLLENSAPAVADLPTA